MKSVFKVINADFKILPFDFATKNKIIWKLLGWKFYMKYIKTSLVSFSSAVSSLVMSHVAIKYNFSMNSDLIVTYACWQ